METRASYVAVGLFVLIFSIGTMMSFLWLGKDRFDRAEERYTILFYGTVGGLQPDGIVRYLGVPVGRVKELQIDPDDSSRVRVTILIDADTPVRVDSVATLTLQGLTGVSAIQISPGNVNSPLLKSTPPPRIIASRRSDIDSLLSGTPLLLDNLLSISVKINDILSQKNVLDVISVISNLNKFILLIYDQVDKLEPSVLSMGNILSSVDSKIPIILNNVDATLTGTRATLTEIEQLSRSINRQIGSEEMHALLGAVTEVARQLSSLVSENRESVRDFTGEGLNQAAQLFVELRELAGNISKFIVRLERDPGNTLLGSTRNGVQTELQDR